MDYHPDPAFEHTQESPNLLCVRRAYEYFHGNFNYFGLAFLAPVLFTYCVRLSANAMARSLMRGVDRPHMLSLAKAAALGAIRWGGFGLASVIFGLVAGGTTLAVRELRCGNRRPEFERALEPPRARLASVAGSALLQFFGLFLSVGVCILLAAGIVFKLGLPISLLRWIGWAASALCLSVFSRWMLSVSVIVNEGCGVLASFRRSQKLTADYTPAMLLFVAHAAVAGYIAGMIPYYVFNLVAGRVALPIWSGWLPFALSFVFVAWTEPLCAIGCAETYYAAHEREKAAIRNADLVKDSWT
jgi:hypothetical protein